MPQPITPNNLPSVSAQAAAAGRSPTVEALAEPLVGQMNEVLSLPWTDEERRLGRRVYVTEGPPGEPLTKIARPAQGAAAVEHTVRAVGVTAGVLDAVAAVYEGKGWRCAVVEDRGRAWVSFIPPPTGK